MKLRAAWCIGLGLVACEGDTDTKTGTGETGTPGAEACANAVDETIPEDGATEVYYRSTIRMTLNVEDKTAAITLADADGNDVPGDSTIEGRTVVFAPDAPLERSATYTATLSYECETDEVVTFTTSTTGNPLEVDPVGRVYNLDLAQGLFTRPAGAADLIGGLITQDISVFFMPTTITEDPGGDTISFIGAAKSMTDPTTQELCADPFFVDGADWTEPRFEGTTPFLAISIIDLQVTVVNPSLSGDISVDGSQIEIGRFTGEIDSREVMAGINFDICGLVPCFACSNDSDSETCTELQVENLTLQYLPDVAALIAEPECPNN